MKQTFLILFITSSFCMFSQHTANDNNILDNLGIEMVYVKGGIFTMGCRSDQINTCKQNENPAHKVTLPDFYIGKYEITQAQWEAVMGDNPSYFKERIDTNRVLSMGAVKVFIQNLNENTGEKYVVPVNNKECYYDGRYHIGGLNIMEADWEALMASYKGEIFEGRTLPVERVSWYDVQVFIEKLNDLTDMIFRLPTEAEWEYAARGGSKSASYYYSGSNKADDVMWYYENAGDYRKDDGTWSVSEAIKNKTHPVGSKLPNELGIYDMSGNVWEWCNDMYGEYSFLSQTNPQGAKTGDERVLRGGSWRNDAQCCSVSFRYFLKPDSSSSVIGFRLMRSI